MAAREIEITISANGTVQAEVKGIKGVACREYTRMLAELLGEEISFTPTAEYYEAEEGVELDINQRY